MGDSQEETHIKTLFQQILSILKLCVLSTFDSKGESA